MKSQFYHEIEVLETFPKKRKKQTPNNPQLIKSIHPSRCRPSRSQKRTMINSVDLRTQPREIQQHSTMLRSKLPLPNVDIEHCAQWIELKCIDCEAMRVQNSKKQRELQMKFEEQLTQCKEGSVMMEKKYLRKQHELISLMNDYEKVLEEGELKQNQIFRLNKQNILLRQQIQAIQRQKATLYTQIECLVMDRKLNAQKIQNMHYFLKLYQQQTKVVLSWAKILSQIQEQVEALQLLKQQILSRKFDCEVTLKQAITFEKLNFSDIPHASEQASFIEDDSSCETFMKYLRQEKHNGKSRTAAKGKQNCQGQGWQNKENIDYNNISTTKSSLLHSRKNQVKKRTKAMESQPMLRMILMQAKAMQQYTKGQLYCSNEDQTMLDCSHLSLQKSVICK